MTPDFILIIPAHREESVISLMLWNRRTVWIVTDFKFEIVFSRRDKIAGHPIASSTRTIWDVWVREDADGEKAKRVSHEWIAKL